MTMIDETAAPANAAPPIPQGGLEVVSIAKSYDKREVMIVISLCLVIVYVIVLMWVFGV